MRAPYFIEFVQKPDLTRISRKITAYDPVMRYHKVLKISDWM